jgi:hypothetical protein
VEEEIDAGGLAAALRAPVGNRAVREGASEGEVRGEERSRWGFYRWREEGEKATEAVGAINARRRWSSLVVPFRESGGRGDGAEALKALGGGRGRGAGVVRTLGRGGVQHGHGRRKGGWGRPEVGDGPDMWGGVSATRVREEVEQAGGRWAGRRAGPEEGWASGEKEEKTKKREEGEVGRVGLRGPIEIVGLRKNEKKGAGWARKDGRPDWVLRRGKRDWERELEGGFRTLNFCFFKHTTTNKTNTKS